MHYNIHLRWDGRAVAAGRGVLEFADCGEQPLLNGGRRFSAYDPRVCHAAIQVDGNFHGDILLKTWWQVAGWNHRKLSRGPNGKVILVGREAVKLADFNARHHSRSRGPGVLTQDL